MPTRFPASRPAQSSGPASCAGCEAREHGLCGALNETELVSLSQRSTRRIFDSGETLGGISRGDGLANILSGVVSLSKRLSDGRQQIVGLQFAPSLIGSPFVEVDDTELTAAGVVRLCTFSRAEFETVVSGNPAAEHRVFSQTLRHLDDTRDWLLAVGRKSALERVASYILMIAAHLPSPQSADPIASISLPHSRREIGEFLGLTIETVSRKMTELRKAGTIETETGSSVRILRLNQLRLVSGE